MSLPAVTRSELTKQFTTAGWWVLLLILVIYVAFTAAVLGFVYTAASTGSLGDDAPPLPSDVLAPVLYSTGTAVAYVFPVLAGTMMVTTEFRHKTLTPTFLAVPHRGRVLGGKVVAGILMGVIYGVAGVIASVGPGAGFLAGYGLDTELGDPDIWAQLGRMVLAFILWMLIGIGVGALVRNQVGAIVGVLVFTQFIEPIARAAAAFVDGLDNLTRFLPGAASDALVGASVFAIATPESGGADPLEWWIGGLVLAAYAAVLVLLGYLVSWRRDIA